MASLICPRIISEVTGEEMSLWTTHNGPKRRDNLIKSFRTINAAILPPGASIANVQFLTLQWIPKLIHLTVQYHIYSFAPANIISAMNRSDAYHFMTSLVPDLCVIASSSSVVIVVVGKKLIHYLSLLCVCLLSFHSSTPPAPTHTYLLCLLPLLQHVHTKT